MPTPKAPSVVEVAEQVAATLDGPIAYDEFAQRVLAIRPSSSKQPIAQTKKALRSELNRIGLTFADTAHKQVVPISTVMNGLTVRHIFTAEEIATRRLYLTDDELILLLNTPSMPMNEVIKRLRLVDAHSAEVKATVDQVSQQVSGRLRTFTITTPTLHMPRWLAEHAVKAGDAALFTILDYTASRWQIVHEPAARRRQPEIDAANRTLADLLFAQLENAQDERVYLRETLLTAFAQLPPAQRTYPGDPWTRVIRLDGRMHENGHQLMYAEHRSMLEKMFENLIKTETASLPAALSPEQGGAIYRLKIHPTGNKKLWRQIEILGAQTLRDLNEFLVVEFKHDWDHMGGFWRLVPRGASKRMREVEIAQVSPFADAEDEGADLRLAELNLEVGSRLRWVYDFGASHQYDLLIEAVEEASPTPAVTDFPRVVAQNKPEYLYCTLCQAEGRQSIATYICYDCTHDREQTVAYCDACLRQHDDEHEDHYTEEIVY